MLGVSGSMRGRKVEQDHGSLLARPVVNLVQRAVQAHHRVSRPTGDELAITEETGQAGRIEEIEPLGILATSGQRVLACGRAEPEDLSRRHPAMTEDLSAK